MYHIGIDPGSEGAAVILKDQMAVAAAYWKPVTRNKKRVRKLVLVYRGGVPSSVLTTRFSEIGYQLLGLTGLLGIKEATLACEDFYFGKNVRTTIELAKGAGSVVTPLEHRLSVPTSWVPAADWRQIVLGLKRNSKRNVVKNASLLLIPKRVRGLADLARQFGSPDHITDAAGIAEWSRITREGINGSKHTASIRRVEKPSKKAAALSLNKRQAGANRGKVKG